MTLTLLLAALSGGVVFFFWGFISWVVLPWHHKTYSAFADEDEVVRVIEKNALASGLYGIPTPGCGGGATTPEARKAAMERATARMKSGPMVSAVVRREGMAPMGLYMARGFLFGTLACLLAAWLLSKTAIVSPLHRALFVMLVALVGSFTVHLSNWNWHNHPTRSTLTLVADAVIGWFLAGLAIAYVLPV